MSHEKLYIVAREDLPPGPQAVQSVHAAIQFIMDHPETGKGWFEDSNHVALLSVPDEQSLAAMLAAARSEGLSISEFREPDLHNQLTAIALSPGRRSRRLCSKLKLLLCQE